MRRLGEALEDPSHRSYPKRLRTLRQNDVHMRAEKSIDVPELQNWLESGYNFGSVIWDKYQIMCSKENKPPGVDNFFAEIKNYLSQKKQTGVWAFFIFLV